ncbi:enolase C-terminal domain-like protein [Variovorax terrae]|uniref:Mandelate racemase n=1 Tax=Variovorax terrae TaxID=2923278 RepID=A0A9X1VVT8_9BURK|nr:enolase C-terminal domain-like protein [Variovorax terrae]MCJ0764200.1 mandelate racemase [Variovorax terrae]
MRITRIVERAVPLQTRLSNARSDFSQMTTTVVAVVSDVIHEGRPLVGYAFNSFGRYACGEQIRERIAPRILAADPDSLLDEAGENFDPAAIMACGQHRERRGGYAERAIPMGTVDVAVWDLVAKVAQQPLHRLLAERYSGGAVRERVPTYVGGGWYFPGQTADDLRAEMARHREAGYTMVKMKVGGLPVAQDCRRIEAILSVMGEGRNLAVDASCSFGHEAAHAYARAISPYGLRWFEEPCDSLEYGTYAALAQAYEGPLATGENMACALELDHFLTYGGFRPDRDIIQIDPPLAFGITEYLKVVAVAEAHGFTRQSLYPHGGNMMCLHLAGGLGLGACESYPDTFGLFSGFSDEVRIADGQASLPETPGIGFERQPALYEVMRDLAA